MTKDVLVTVKGLQSMEDGSPPEEVEMVAKGEYYYKNGHHYIFYNETIEGFTEQNRNSIKISENSVEVKKKGLTNMQMIFEEQKKNISYYVTPFGNLQMGIAATNIDIKEQEKSLELCIDYALEINGEHAADCQIAVSVKEKGSGEFSLSI
jgi:uncharacterized beta-barrel protein YwiB (DUF1934 family)